MIPQEITDIGNKLETQTHNTGNTLTLETMTQTGESQRPVRITRPHLNNNKHPRINIYKNNIHSFDLESRINFNTSFGNQTGDIKVLIGLRLKDSKRLTV